jgi:hypothetical protein
MNWYRPTLLLPRPILDVIDITVLNQYTILNA